MLEVDCDGHDVMVDDKSVDLAPATFGLMRIRRLPTPEALHESPARWPP